MNSSQSIEVLESHIRTIRETLITLVAGGANKAAFAPLIAEFKKVSPKELAKTLADDKAGSESAYQAHVNDLKSRNTNRALDVIIDNTMAFCKTLAKQRQIIAELKETRDLGAKRQIVDFENSRAQLDAHLEDDVNQIKKLQAQFVAQCDDYKIDEKAIVASYPHDLDKQLTVDIGKDRDRLVQHLDETARSVNVLVLKANAAADKKAVAGKDLESLQRDLRELQASMAEEKVNHNALIETLQQEQARINGWNLSLMLDDPLRDEPQTKKIEDSASDVSEKLSKLEQDINNVKELKIISSKLNDKMRAEQAKLPEAVAMFTKVILAESATYRIQKAYWSGLVKAVANASTSEFKETLSATYQPLIANLSKLETSVQSVLPRNGISISHDEKTSAANLTFRAFQTKKADFVAQKAEHTHQIKDGILQSYTLKLEKIKAQHSQQVQAQLKIVTESVAKLAAKNSAKEALLKDRIAAEQSKVNHAEVQRMLRVNPVVTPNPLPSRVSPVAAISPVRSKAPAGGSFFKAVGWSVLGVLAGITMGLAILVNLDLASWIFNKAVKKSFANASQNYQGWKNAGKVMPEPQVSTSIAPVRAARVANTVSQQPQSAPGNVVDRSLNKNRVGFFKPAEQGVAAASQPRPAAPRVIRVR